jgi:hypothetical protein
MQTGLSPADRRILTVAGGLFVALTVITIVGAPLSPTAWSSNPSTYLSTPGGARAAFLLLQRLGVKTERWQEPPLRLVALAQGATLVLAEPAETPSRRECTALRRFVEQGGRVLFCGAELSRFFPEVKLQKVSYAPVPVLEQEESAPFSVEQYWPVLKTRTSKRIELRAHALWQQFENGQAPVYGRPDNAVVAIWAMGEGELIWWASATPLTNAGLRRAGNLQLFLNSAGASREQVYWDEYFHGERGSLFAYAGRVPVIRWAAFQLALLICACLLAFSRRSGPVIPTAKISRLSPLEFAETLGGLYQKAKATQVAVDIALRHLRLQMARRLALPAAISDADLARAAAERLGWEQQDLESLLARAHAAPHSVVPSSTLQLVQRLQRFSARLASPPAVSERK